MDDEAAFLAAMRAAPASRLTRHVYADWLEERGDPRHELVRVCEAMRTVPVWSDAYWELKARRNALWTHFPIEWLEATGYDGSDYDPVFRDGVPDGVKERWRLIREFTERWHGVSVPDVGGQRDAIAREEARLGLTLPESVREYVAFARDTGDDGVGDQGEVGYDSLFHCAFYQLERLAYHPSLSLINYTLSDGVLAVALDDLHNTDPRVHLYEEYPSVEATTHRIDSWFDAPSLSVAIFELLFTNLPTAGALQTTADRFEDISTQLAADFQIHTHFDSLNIYESSEMLVSVSGMRPWSAGATRRSVEAMVRRPVPVKSIPNYLVRSSDANHSVSGMLYVERFRMLSLEQQPPAQPYPAAQWVSVLRRAEAARATSTGEPSA